MELGGCVLKFKGAARVVFVISVGAGPAGKERWTRANEGVQGHLTAE